MRASQSGTHISGAETITTPQEIETILRSYTKRALLHERGEPDQITISIEKLTETPLRIKALNVFTLKTRTHEESLKHINTILSVLGISEPAIKTALSVVYSDHAMRGAAIVEQKSGKRLEPDPERGIRVSRLGIDCVIKNELLEKIKALGLNPTVVSEAITLASKVASAPEVVAELCVSDDPCYTTGYIGSKSFGYVRIPHIKPPGVPSGGRVFFVTTSTDTERLIKYLERVPVLISNIPDIHGIITIDELIGTAHS